MTDLPAMPNNKPMMEAIMRLVPIAIATTIVFAYSMQAMAQSDMGFDVNVTLSKKAAAKLAAEKEELVVFASYYGDPKRSAEKHANEIGQISVSPEDEEVKIPGTGGHAHVSGTKVDKQTLKWVEGNVMVNVNVASARGATLSEIKCRKPASTCGENRAYDLSLIVG